MTTSKFPPRALIGALLIPLVLAGICNSAQAQKAKPETSRADWNWGSAVAAGPGKTDEILWC